MSNKYLELYFEIKKRILDNLSKKHISIDEFLDIVDMSDSEFYDLMNNEDKDFSKYIWLLDVVSSL